MTSECDQLVEPVVKPVRGYAHNCLGVRIPLRLTLVEPLHNLPSTRNGKYPVKAINKVTPDYSKGKRTRYRRPALFLSLTPGRKAPILTPVQQYRATRKGIWTLLRGWIKRDSSIVGSLVHYPTEASADLSKQKISTFPAFVT